MSFLKKILIHYNYLPVYLLIIFLFNLSFQKLPLVSVFGYEFSALNSIILILLSGIYFVSLLKKLQLSSERKKEIFQNALTACVSFLLVPFLVSIIHSLLSTSCSIIDGLLFYLVITFPSVGIGFALALISVTVTRKFNLLLFIFIYILVLSIPLFEFYFNPQIYFFNPIFGYYPGTIYDEGLNVTSKLVGYRIFNLVYFGAISIVLFGIYFGKLKFQKSVAFIIIILIALIFIYISPRLGYSTTFSRLNSELSGTVETQHFTIHFEAKMNENLIKAISIYHEYYYSQLKNFFGYDYPRKINSYLFSDNSQKKKLFGSANADVAKPWLNCAFITYSDYEATLKHELAHCYSSEFGSGIFKVASGLNPFLIEGTAMAADPIYDNNDVNYLASLAYNNGYRINLENIFNYFNFFTQASSTAYIYAGSFSSFLIGEFGISKFKRFYHDGNFGNDYNIPLRNVIQKYYSTLKDSSLTKNIDEANYYYGRRSIFYKTCPRYVADRTEKAWEYYNGKNYAKSKNLFEGVLKITNDYSAVIGFASCQEKLNQFDEAVKFLERNLSQFKNSAYYYSMELKLGDLLSLNKNFVRADSIYECLINQNPNHTYFYLANLRCDLLKSDSLIRPYLLGNEFDKYNILTELNSENYDYYSIPVLIDLANSFNENYDLFIKQFHKKIEVTDFQSSFAMFKLSNYMLAHLDFNGARRIAALALRYNDDKDFQIILKSNFNKADWFYKNYSNVLKNVKFYQYE